MSTVSFQYMVMEQRTANYSITKQRHHATKEEIYRKLEALGQCIPPPRHILTSVAISVPVSPDSDESEKQSLYPDGDPGCH